MNHGLYRTWAQSQYFDDVNIYIYILYELDVGLLPCVYI